MYCEPDICNWFIWLVKCWTELCCIGPTLCSRLEGVTAVAASWLWVQQKGRKDRWVKNVSVLGGGGGSCNSSPNPKSQLVWYHNHETMGNNDIECCVIAFCEQWGNTLWAAQVHYWCWSQGGMLWFSYIFGFNFTYVLQSLFQTYYHTLPSPRLRDKSN